MTTTATRAGDGRVYVLVTAVLFMLLFGPKTLAGNFDTLGATCAVALVVWRRYASGVLTSIDFWITVLAMGYVLLVLALTSVADGWWALKPPRVLLNYVGVFGFTTWSLQRFGRRRTLLMLHNAITAHAVVVLLMVFWPAFGDWIAGLFGGVTKSTFQVSGLTRGLALSALVMMFPFVTYPLFSILEGYRERGVFLKLLVIAVATFFMGRTGFYLCLAAAFAVLFVLGLRNARSFRIMLGAFAASGICFLLLIQFQRSPGSSILGLVPGTATVLEPVRHMLEPIINYLDGRGLRAKSVEHILDMPVVYHNDTVWEVIFGTGLYGRGDPWTYLPTDVAYLHMFSAFGVLGLALFLLTYLAPYPQYVSLWRRAAYWASFAIALMTIVANFKETALFTRNIYTIHVFFIAWLVHERNALRQ